MSGDCVKTVVCRSVTADDVVPQRDAWSLMKPSDSDQFIAVDWDDRASSGVSSSLSTPCSHDQIYGRGTYLFAGVIGLTTALLLARDGKKHRVTVIAKHMPGDYDIDFSTLESLAGGFERDTWPDLEHLARNVPEAGIHFQGLILSFGSRKYLADFGRTDAHIYRRAKDASSEVGALFAQLSREDAWFKDVVPSVSIAFLLLIYSTHDDADHV
nr:d-amino-acid oxidase [Quercus suber]